MWGKNGNNRLYYMRTLHLGCFVSISCFQYTKIALNKFHYAELEITTAATVVNNHLLSTCYAPHSVRSVL